MNQFSIKSASIILLALIVVAFFNGLNNPFMLDDYGFFGVNAKQPLWSFFVPNRNEALGLDSPQMEKTYYRPLAHVIPLVCHRVFGGDPFGYHVVNMLLVWGAAVAVFVFLRRLRNMTEIPGWGDRDWDFFAFLTAALFALHPINGVLVNYITASVFAAQVVFMLISLVLSQGHQSSSAPGSQKIDSWGAGALGRWGSIAFLILALFCHETAVLLPFYAILVLRLKFSWPDVFRRVMPLFLVLGIYFLFRMYASPFGRSFGHSFSILGLSIDQKAATVIQLLSWYFEKLFVPKNIFLMWSTPFVREASWMWWAPVLVISGFGFGILARKHSRHCVTMFTLWFLLGLSPIAAGAFVTPYLGALIEPHWFVFGSIGFFAAAACGICYFSKGAARVVIISVVIGALMALSFVNNRLWSNEQKYYEAWSKEAPYFKAVHYFLGLTLSRQGELDEAYGHLKQAVLGRYKDWMVYMELGLIDLRFNRLEAASENLRKAYTLERNHSGLLNAVGALAYKLGKVNEAKDFWERSVKSNPYNLEPRMNLGSYYVKTGDLKKAAETYQEIIRQYPKFMPAQKALGRLQRQGT